MDVRSIGPATRGMTMSRSVWMRGGRETAGALALIGLLLAALACSGPTIAPPPPEPVTGDRDPYVIGVTDQLQISVWKNPELSVPVVVRADGMISVPLLDDVQAEGLTTGELKEIITTELAEYVANPDVTVVVTQMNSNVAAVMGAVGRSGTVPLRRDTRVLEAIATMGGFNAFAKRNKVRILRPTADGVVEYRFDYDAFLNGKAPNSNMVLKAGDTVVVPE